MNNNAVNRAHFKTLLDPDCQDQKEFQVLKSLKFNKGLQRIITRQLSLKVPPGTSKHGSVPNVEAYRKVQDLQNHFLRDDGLLVWQKRGPRDRIPYIISVCTCIGGLALTVYNLKTMAFPVKAD